MFFELSEENVRSRQLSADDFSKAAGFEVRVFSGEEFPFSTKNVAELYYFPDRLQARAEAVFARLKKEDLIGPGLFDFDSAKSSALLNVANARVSVEELSLSDTPYFQHFNLLLKNGVENAHCSGSAMWWKTSFSTGKSDHDVFPGVLNEDIPVDGVWRTRAAYLIRPPAQDGFERIANQICLPQEYIGSACVDDFLPLLQDLHEQRHLYQYHLHSSCPAAGYYIELDADLAARHTLRKAKIGHRSLVADVNARYLGMLYLPDTRFWFAQTLEHVEAQKAPPNYFQSCQSVAEIRIRLDQHFRGEPFTHFSHERIEEAFHKEGSPSGPIADRYLESYQNNLGTKKMDGFAPLYTGLRNVYESGIFSGSRTADLAKRIIAAAQYFNNDLVYLDCPEARGRLLSSSAKDLRPSP